MNVKKLLLATVVVGVVMNIVDFLVQGQLLVGLYATLPLFKREPPIPWLVFGDFVSALVFVWVYDRVQSSFGGGVKGGATYGLYAGILINFPTWIFAHLIFEGFPYSLAWTWTLVGVVWCVIAGAVAGALYKK
ncbi:MAG TPA: hypothetical protein VJ648_03430 [Vicinamibacteria bacterium]|nr:hypothetical protein [Vicinamibacteria bacterium]